MIPDTRRTDRNFVPLELLYRRSGEDSSFFEVLTQSGEVLAKGIPDANSARLFAMAPRILEALNSANWVVGNYADALVRDAKKEGRVTEGAIESALASTEELAAASLANEFKPEDVELDPAISMLLISRDWRKTEQQAYASDGLFPIR